MANVYTKRWHRPRATTLKDFSLKDTQQPHIQTRRTMMSPTRQGNPHPTGLTYQSAYNKDNKTFGIWNPDFAKIALKFPMMACHLERANFTSGPILLPLTKKKLPTIHYTLSTTTRVTYQWPKFPDDVQTKNINQRVGRKHSIAAKGIVPNALPSIKQGQMKQNLYQRTTPSPTDDMAVKRTPQPD